MSDSEVEEPEVREPIFRECHYCGAVFEISAAQAARPAAHDDCGSCRLTGEDLERYARDMAPRVGEP